MIVPPDGYFAAIGEVLRRYDVLLIADEVVCAFGRLGHWFGTEVFGLQPDLITLAKGITSAYVPLSASLVSAPGRPRRWPRAATGIGVLGHGYTYSAHPLAAAAALTNLGIIGRGRTWSDQAAKRGDYLQQRLQRQLRRPPARGRGAWLRPDRGSRVRRQPIPLARLRPGRAGGRPGDRGEPRHGVLTRALPASDTIAFSPPFVVTEARSTRWSDVTRRALDTSRPSSGAGGKRAAPMAALIGLIVNPVAGTGGRVGPARH